MTPDPQPRTTEAFGLETLFRERRTALVATLATTSGDPDAAAEAVDEAFVRAAQRWDRVSMMDSPTGWILTVAKNHLRRTKSRGRRRHDAETRSSCPTWIEPTDPRYDLWEAVAQLPAREREAIAFRYLADLTEAQAARVMGIAEGTVSATLASARRRLASALEPQEAIGDE